MSLSVRDLMDVDRAHPCSRLLLSHDEPRSRDSAPAIHRSACLQARVPQGALGLLFRVVSSRIISHGINNTIQEVAL